MLQSVWCCSNVFKSWKHLIDGFMEIVACDWKCLVFNLTFFLSAYRQLNFRRVTLLIFVCLTQILTFLLKIIGILLWVTLQVLAVLRIQERDIRTEPCTPCIRCTQRFASAFCFLWSCNFSSWTGSSSRWEENRHKPMVLYALHPHRWCSV